MAIKIRTKIIVSIGSIFILLFLLGIIAIYNRNIIFQGMADMKEGAHRLGALIEFQDEEMEPERDLTISLGVATFPDDANDVIGIIKKADDALYMAKEKGRNRVEVGQEPSPDGEIQVANRSWLLPGLNMELEILCPTKYEQNSS